MYPSDICRVCMFHGLGMTSIFKPTVGTPIDIMIISITSINPLPYDGLPSQLCKYCLDMLKQCFAFRQRIIKSDIKFRQAQTPSNLLKSSECNKTGDIHSNSGNSALADINLGESKGDSESLNEYLFMSKDDNALSNDISQENKQFQYEGVINIGELQIVQVIGNYDVNKNSFEIDEHLRKIEFNTKQSENEIKNDAQNEACFSKKASNNSSEQVGINKFQQKQLKSVTSPCLNNNNINIQGVDIKDKNRQQISTASFKNTIFESSEVINAVNHVQINTSQSSEESRKTSTPLLKSSKCNKGNSALAETNLPERGKDLESLTENKQIQNEDVTNIRELKIVQVIGDYNANKNFFEIDEHLRKIEFSTKYGNMKSKESMKSMFSDESIAICINENKAKRQKVISTDLEIDLPRNNEISENKLISQTDNVEVYNVKNTKQSDIEVKNDKQVIIEELQQNQLKSVTSPPLEIEKLKCIQGMNPKDKTTHLIITDFCKNKSFETSEDINEVNHLPINMSQSSGESDEVNISETDDNDSDYRPNIKISQKKKKPKSGRGLGRPKKLKTNEPNKIGKENTLEIDYNKSIKEGETKQYKKKILCCNVCDFTCTKNIKRHMATHLIEKPHVCVKCNRTFAQNDKLLRHECTCQGKRVIICEACNKTFELEAELNEHLNTEIVAERCQGLKKSKTISLENYTDPERLSKFYSIYFETENPVELTSEAIENNNWDNETLVQVYTPNGRKKRKVGRPRKQKIKINEDQVESEGQYPCPVCSEEFTKMTDLETHGREVHVDYQVLKCPAKLHAIDAGERQKDEESHLCGRCRRKFTTAKALKFHMRKHEAEDSFVCSKCAKPFNSKTNLVEHMKFHAPKRKFLCSICGLGFARNDNLVIHMRRHRGDKPYACQYCGKGFTRQTEVKIHERYHTGEKTHLCTVCGRGFAKKFTLNVHMRTHTGEKPYECTYCDVAFAQNSQLKLHVQRYTGDCFQCDICVAKFIMGCELIQHKQKVHGLNTEAQQVKGPQPKAVKLPEPIVARPLVVFTEKEVKN